MNKCDKEKYFTMPTIAINYDYNLLIKDIKYDIDDSIIFVSKCGAEGYNVHKCKIYYGNESYFVYKGHRVKTNNCLKV